jgi:hypothetical protein
MGHTGTGPAGSSNDRQYNPIAILAMQTEEITVDKELLIRALTDAENAIGFGSEVLAVHDSNLGRTWPRHKEQALYIEQQIDNAKQTTVKLREALGWPQKEWL